MITTEDLEERCEALQKRCDALTSECNRRDRYYRDLYDASEEALDLLNQMCKERSWLTADEQQIRAHLKAILKEGYK